MLSNEEVSGGGQLNPKKIAKMGILAKKLTADS
jgi:hypothetical protein